MKNEDVEDLKRIRNMINNILKRNNEEKENKKLWEDLF